MRRLYPEPRKHRRLPAIDELILTILSQNTSDVNSHAAYLNLRKKFPTWDRVAKAPAKQIVDAIRKGGLAAQKGPRIKSILREIHAERGKYDIEHVGKMPLDEALEYLMHFNGVGMKTASCVMLFSCRKPAFPVDTHILRVSKRLGIIGPKDGADKATKIYMDHTEPDERLKFHIDIIMFGREICHPRQPECNKCDLTRMCVYYRDTVRLRKYTK